MASSLQQIEEQARSLSAEDRAKLAECMLESLHTSIEEIEAAWSEEIAMRIDAFEKGDISAYPAEQLFAEARQILQ
jgi:putative addiction module component (TIGR02574 family)